MLPVYQLSCNFQKSKFFLVVICSSAFTTSQWFRSAFRNQQRHTIHYQLSFRNHRQHNCHLYCISCVVSPAKTTLILVCCSWSFTQIVMVSTSVHKSECIFSSHDIMKRVQTMVRKRKCLLLVHSLDIMKLKACTECCACACEAQSHLICTV